MSLPNLNGQVKTPLRWYPKRSMPFWNSDQCREWHPVGDKQFTVVGMPGEVPPFQLVMPASDAVPTSWIIYLHQNNSVVADITGQVDMLVQHAMADGDHFLFYGGPVGAVLPTEVAMYGVIEFSDGTAAFSELFSISCDAVAASGDLVVDDDLTDLIGWKVGSTDNEADDTYSGGSGTPVVADPFELMQVINTVDDKVYTYISGAWNSGTTPSTGDYRLVSATGQWLEFNGSAWVAMASPPWETGSTGVCIGENPDNIGLVLNDLDTDDGTWDVRVVLGPMTQGYIDVELGGLTAVRISRPGIHTIAFDGPGLSAILAMSPSANFDGCVYGVRVYRGALGLACHNILTWSHCGDVGITLYRDGFENYLILPAEHRVVRPTFSIDVKATENGDGSTVESAVRKEVRWSLNIGTVPWHVADAVTEAAAVDTFRIVHREAIGADDILLPQFDQEYVDGVVCLSDVDLQFSVNDATSATACCDLNDAACIEPCMEVAGFDSDEVLVEGSWYAIEDAQQVALMGSVSLGAPVRCDSGLVSFEDGRIMHYWSAIDGQWIPLAVLSSVGCADVDCTAYLIQADVMPGYRGRLQFSTDATTWEDTDLDLSAADWEDNTTTIELSGGYIRMKVYAGDCILDYTDATMLPCEDGFKPYMFDGTGTDADPGTGRFKIDDAVVADVTEIYVSATDFNGTDQTGYWLSASGQVVIRPQVDGADDVVYNLSAIGNNGTWITLAVTHVSGDLPDKADMACCLQHRTV